MNILQIMLYLLISLGQIHIPFFKYGEVINLIIEFSYTYTKFGCIVRQQIKEGIIIPGGKVEQGIVC